MFLLEGTKMPKKNIIFFTHKHDIPKQGGGGVPHFGKIPTFSRFFGNVPNLTSYFVAQVGQRRVDTRAVLRPTNLHPNQVLEMFFSTNSH